MKRSIENGMIHHSTVFDEYGITFPEDGISYLLIQYCPWCGNELPKSQRTEWFRRLEDLGYESPLFDDNIPVEYKSSKWRE